VTKKSCNKRILAFKAKVALAAIKGDGAVRSSQPIAPSVWH
jgi:hypothetical protein